MSSSSIASVLEPFLQQIVNGIDGAEGIIVSTDDIVNIAQYWKDGSQEERSAPAAIFPFVAEQLAKLPWGAVKSMTTEFESSRLVHIYLKPLIITVVGNKKLDVQKLESDTLMKKLELGFQQLRNAVPSS